MTTTTITVGHDETDGTPGGFGVMADALTEEQTTEAEVVTRVNGAETAPPNRLSITSEIATEKDLPWTNTAGVVAAVADVEWGQTRGVDVASEHPWLPGWNKRPGAAFTVAVDFPGRDVPWPAFTGTIEDSSVDVGGATVSSRCIDASTRCQRPVTIGPVAYRMPPTTWESETAGQRWPGMSASWAFGEILRQCGFYPHQPQLPEADWFASNLGSAWPVVGAYLQEAYSTARSNPGAGTYLAPYAREFTWPGGGLQDLWAHGRTTSAGIGGPRALYVNVDTFDPAGAATTIRRTHDLGGDGFQISILPGEFRLASVIGGVATLRGTLTRDDTTTIVGVTWDGTTLRMRTDSANGGIAAWTGGLGAFGSTARDTIYCNATGGAKVGCIQGARSTSIAPFTAPRTARFHMDMYTQAVNGGVGAVPYIDRQDGLGLLTRAAMALMLSFWFDETGTPVLADRGWLEAQPVSRVITDTDLYGIGPVDVPGNAFADPWPTAAAGLTLSAATTADYRRDTEPYVRLAATAAGSTLNRSAAFAGSQRIPATAGTTLSVSVQGRSMTATPGMLRVQFYRAGGAAVGAPVDSAPTSGGRAWERVEVVATPPRGATSAEVRFGNAQDVAFDDETDWRAFTTLGPGVLLKALMAALEGAQPRSEVVVRGRQSTLSVSSRQNRLLAAGSKEQLRRGETREWLLVPDDVDTHWLGLDDDYRWAGTPYPDPYSTWLNSQEGCWVGGHLVRRFDHPTDENIKAGSPYYVGEDSPPNWVGPDQLAVTTQMMGPNAILVTATATTAVPADAEIITQISPYSPGAWESRKGDPLPEWRGARVRFIDADPAVVQVTGDPAHPAIEHDGDWWLQSVYQRQTIAAAIAAHLADPQPILTGVECRLAPINLGDRVVIHVTSVAQITLDVVVTATSLDIAADTMTLDGRVIAATVDGITYGQDADAYGNRTYQQGTGMEMGTYGQHV